MSREPQSLDQWHILKEFSWDTGVVIALTVWWLRHGLDNQSTVVWFLTDPRNFSLLQNIQTGTDAHPNSYSPGNEPCASWDKAAWTCKMFASFIRKYASENFKWKHIYLVTAHGLHGTPGTQVFHAVWNRNSGVQCPAEETRRDGCWNQGTWRIYKRDGESCTNWSCFFGWICQQVSSTAVTCLTDC